MKTRKNKKFYNFTEKQKRRDRSYGKGFWLNSVPSSYRRAKNKERQAKAKNILRRILNGKEVEFIPEKSNLGWFYW